MKRSQDYPLTIRPVVTLSDEYPAGYVDPFHSHERAQLSFSLSGVQTVTTDTASYVLPPNRAIWIPPGVRHQTNCREKVRFYAVYIDPTLDNLPSECRVFEVSDLVRALIGEIMTFNFAYDEAGREGQIVRLLLDEIPRMPSVDIHIPMPTDSRILRVCTMLIDHPGDPRDIDHWAAVANMGRRTFTRVFKHQTGMGLATWRLQVRLMHALSLLHAGHSITTVAYGIGYESVSAFTSVFHRSFGFPPSYYRATQAAKGAIRKA
ncbi:helix-turn-helix domain-containing protein [Shinella sp.]|uniref:AraC family ligand binding domain-containing protein n=1 Tax=Shinella sp. TaxID=1870904 RepID=UPI003F6FE75E